MMNHTQVWFYKLFISKVYKVYADKLFINNNRINFKLFEIIVELSNGKCVMV